MVSKTVKGRLVDGMSREEQEEAAEEEEGLPAATAGTGAKMTRSGSTWGRLSFARLARHIVKPKCIAVLAIPTITRRFSGGPQRTSVRTLRDHAGAQPQP